MIDNETKERIIAAAKIEEVVGDFVKLHRSGSNLKGLCPFHEEKTPSFMVSPSKNICKCFDNQYLYTNIMYRIKLINLKNLYGISLISH